MNDRDGSALAGLYQAVAAAHARGDHAAARAAYLAAVGLSRPLAEVKPPSPPPPGISLVQWAKPRRIDLVALEKGARDVAKFEDLSLAEARRMQAWGASQGFRGVVAGPYSKQFDVAVAAETERGELYAVILSRGSQAEAVAEAERDRSPEGTRRAGLALGYPPCCVDHFVSLSRDGLARRDGVNEAAIRAIRGVRESMPWELNPLYQSSPVGFSCCSVDCPNALAFARRLLAALSTDELQTVHATLMRPVLFLRHSLLFVLDGEVQDDGAVSYRRVVASALEGPLQGSLGAWHWHELGRVLTEGDAVRRGDELVISRQDEAITTWKIDDPEVPLLLRFR